MRVERYVLVDGHLTNLGHQIAAHGQQQQREAKRKRSSRTTGDRNPVAHHVTQVHVLAEVTVGDEAFDEEHTGGDEKHKEIDDRLAILFQVGDQPVPFAQNKVWLRFRVRADLEAGHSRHIGGGVQEILLRSLAIQANGDQIASVLGHHVLKIFVVQLLLVLEAGERKHALDQVHHLHLAHRVRLGNVHQRSHHLHQLLLIDHPVPIVVAHVEDDPQLIVGLAPGEQHHSVEELLEANTPIVVLVHAVEHLLHKQRVRLHAEGLGELLLRKRGAHHHDHIVAHLFVASAFTGLQAKGERIGFTEKVLQPLLAFLLRLGVRQHHVSVGVYDLQSFLVIEQKLLKHHQEFFTRRHAIELQHQVVVSRRANEHHGLARLLGHLHQQGGRVGNVNLAQRLALPVDGRNRLVGSNLGLYVSLMILVQPLAHI